MNNKLEGELNKLRILFKKLNDPTVSVVITGSVARGEERYIGGKVVSDIDVLLIVKNKLDINPLKEKLKKIENIQFNHDISFVFTLLDTVRLNSGRGYLRSISEFSFIFDGLDIKRFLDEIKSSKNLFTENYFQELTYYYAKYECTMDMYLKDKILRIWNSIYGEGYIIIDIPTKEEIADHVKKYNVKLLESTKFFLQYVDKLDKRELYEKIKNLVFEENQGLSFKDSYYKF